MTLLQNVFFSGSSSHRVQPVHHSAWYAGRTLPDTTGPWACSEETGSEFCNSITPCPGGDGFILESGLLYLSLAFRFSRAVLSAIFLRKQSIPNSSGHFRFGHA